ncbi:hypothetical protein DVH24_025465 [Malus domestica]|uniref:Uncharacterized protein n=1 Tax=Malus domestica TaxID=3750 RepID=A0A498HNU2_MALDO|nr:hypothetical protein DVH24_025465 [Malus domestica]
MLPGVKFSSHKSAVALGRLGASKDSIAPYPLNIINRPLHHNLTLLMGRKMLSLMERRKRRPRRSVDHLLRPAIVVLVSCHIRAIIFVKHAMAVLDDGMVFGCNGGSYLPFLYQIESIEMNSGPDKQYSDKKLDFGI